jgi:hypothetical protein
MTRRLPYLVIVLLGALLIASGAAAQDGPQSADESVIVRTGGTITIGPEETVGTVVMVNGDVTIDGHVTQTLWITNGTATINGQVDGDVVAMNGVVQLGAGASVGNVSLVQSQMERAEGATVSGQVNDQFVTEAFTWSLAAFSFLLWIGVTLVVLLAGVAFAALGNRLLVDSAMTLTSRPGGSVLVALVVWIGVPLLAILAFLTVIGIPLGFVLLVLVLPVLWFLGFIIAGQVVGAWIWRLLGQQPNRYVPVLIGLGIFQLIGLLPAVGGLVGLLAGFLGSGAFVYWLITNRGERREAGPQSTAMATMN